MEPLQDRVSTLHQTLSTETTHFQTFERTVSTVTKSDTTHIHRTITTAIDRVQDLFVTLHTDTTLLDASSAPPQMTGACGEEETAVSRLSGLQKLADNVVAAFEDATAVTDDSLAHIMVFMKEGAEFRTTRIIPVQQQLVAVRRSVQEMEQKTERELERTRAAKESAEYSLCVKGRELEGVRKEAEENEKAVERKREDIRGLERRRTELRGKAVDKRDTGKAIGWGSVVLGVVGVIVAPQIVVPAAIGMYGGVTYGVVAHGEADQLDRQAATLKQSCQNLESEASKLNKRALELNTQQTKLSYECNRYRAEGDSLQNKLYSLKATLAKNSSLETSVKGVLDRCVRLSEETSTIQSQLQQMKADTTACSQLLRERHNEASFMTYLDYDYELAYNETRQQLIESVGEIVTMLKASHPKIMGQRGSLMIAG